MKLFLLTLVFLFSNFPIYAQHDFNLLIGLNMNDCINCYNHDLGRLNQQKDNVDIILVLGESYATDSVKIIKKYNLYGITKHIIWSDSLLNAVTYNGPSAVLFSSKYAALTYRFELKGLPEYLISYIQRAGRPADSLFLDYPKIGLGSQEFYVHGSKVYFINSILDEINGYDLLSGKRIMHFEITDSLLDATFPFSGLPVTDRKTHHDILSRAHMAPYEIQALAFDKDTLYARFMNGYFSIGEDSISKRNNVSMLKIIGKEINHIYRYPYCFVNSFDISKMYCNSGRGFYFYNDAIYNYIYTSTGATPGRHVLGRFEPNKKNMYEMTGVNPMKNPEMYDHTLDCGQLRFDKDYFAFPLIDTLYPIIKDLPSIALNFLPPESKGRSASELCTDGIMMSAFKVSRSFVWVSVYNIESQEYRILKHDRKTRENIYSKIVFSDARRIRHIDFDPINPDYVLYTTPSGNLNRRKMF